MNARGEKKYTIVDAVLEERTQALENGFLAKVDKCVNWLKLRTLVNKKYTKTQNAVGNPAYDMPNAFQDFTLRNMVQLERLSGGRANQGLYHLRQVYQTRLRVHCPRS